jgi:uncharacterized protein YcnI
MKVKFFASAAVFAAVVVSVVALSGGVAWAHVAVQPNQVHVDQFQVFSVGVPSEKDMATTEVKIVMPAGLHEVSPTVKPGWTIHTTKSGNGENATILSITWSDGSIPAGQRDDFSFSAQAPAQAKTLQWKAYQTYEDGTVVSWDQAPSSTAKDDDSGNSGPYSQTKVVNDLAATDTAQNKNSGEQSGRVSAALVLSVIAVLLAAVALQRKDSPKDSPKAKSTKTKE